MSKKGSRENSLEEENSRLRRKVHLLEGTRADASELRTMVASKQRAVHRVVAHELPVLIVDSNWRIKKISPEFIESLGLDPSKAMQSEPLSGIDRLPWAPHIFQVLLEDSRESRSERSFEVEFDDPVAGVVRNLEFSAVFGENDGILSLNDVTKIKRMNLSLEKLISTTVLKELAWAEGDPLAVKHVDLSVLYFDFSSFVLISQDLEIQEFTQALNDVLGIVSESVDKHRGACHNLLDSGVLAFFGAPLIKEDHASKAVQAGLDAIRRITELEARGSLSFSVSCGISSGITTMGFMGYGRHTGYSVVGPNVSLARHLAEIGGSGELRMSKSTIDAAKKIPGSLKSRNVKIYGADETTPRGFARAIPVFAAKDL